MLAQPLLENLLFLIGEYSCEKHIFAARHGEAKPLSSNERLAGWGPKIRENRTEGRQSFCAFFGIFGQSQRQVMVD